MRFVFGRACAAQRNGSHSQPAVSESSFDWRVPVDTETRMTEACGCAVLGLRCLCVLCVWFRLPFAGSVSVPTSEYRARGTGHDARIIEFVTSIRCKYDGIAYRISLSIYIVQNAHATHTRNEICAPLAALRAVRRRQLLRSSSATVRVRSVQSARFHEGCVRRLPGNKLRQSFRKATWICHAFEWSVCGDLTRGV